jgi:hypothetical protein
MQNLWFYRFYHAPPFRHQNLNTMRQAPFHACTSSAFHAVDAACFILEKLEDLLGHILVSTGVKPLAMMLTSL